MLLENCWAMEPGAYAAMMDRCRRGFARADEMIEAAQASLTDDAQRAGLPVRRDGSTAIVGLRGPMLKNASWFSRYFGFAAARDTRAAVLAAGADDDVSTVVLQIDSPGGAVDGTLELAEAVAAVAKVKPVIAQVDGMAASAAYWVASQATRIVMGPTDMVGSIGVRMMLYDFSKLYENEGVEPVPIDTGEFKSAGAEGTKITEAQRADFQRVVDQMFEMFLASVAKGRGVSADRVREVADGRVFLAEEAISLGLADGVQSMDATLAGLRARSDRRSRMAAAAARRQSLAISTQTRL